MTSLQYFKIRFRLVSPLGTPLAADTLFGHLCWSIAYGHGGETALTEFLNAMNGETPPLLLSDPFPAGMLPVPILPSVNQQKWQEKSTEEQDRLKTLRKRTFMPETAFRDCCGNLSPDRLLQVHPETDVSASGKETALVPHNHIDRIGGGTIQGGIFFHEDVFVDHQPGKMYDMFDLYVASFELDADRIKKMLFKATEGGYGRDKSTGRGVIDWQNIEPWIPPKVANANAVMLLGPCVPEANDPTDGYWKIKAKAGRLGGHWAIDENPFKKTIMMLQTGSVLKTETPKPFYGRMVEQAHPNLPEVRHYGLALALPIHLDLTEERAA